MLTEHISQSVPKEDQSVIEWLSYFDAEYARLKQSDFFSFYRVMQSYIHTILAFAEKWNKSFRDVYSLSFFIDLLSKIEHIPEHTLWKQYYYFQYADYQKIMQSCFDGISATIDALDVEKLHEEAPQHLEPLALLLHQKLNIGSTRNHSHWLTVYQRMWTHPLRVRSLVTEEIKRLDHRLADEHISSEQFDLLQNARAYFDLILGHDEAARQRFGSMEGFQVNGIIPYFQTLLDCQDWERIKGWIDWLKPMLPHLHHMEFQAVVNLWDQLSQYQQDDTELLETLIRFLPKSNLVYSDYLLNSGRYKQWIDLQMLRKRSPYELDKEILKEIEQHDHQALLPLYHQAIERAIAAKNRDSYKMAVRLLKKLRAHYKKMKLTERFEDYLAILSGKYTRLRALQEELRKGKLFS